LNINNKIIVIISFICSLNFECITVLMLLLFHSKIEKNLFFKRDKERREEPKTEKVRFEVRNEYKLGQGELYKEANNEGDSKDVLHGVAVDGLVGILRHLGDLAEFVVLLLLFFLFSFYF